MSKAISFERFDNLPETIKTIIKQELIDAILETMTPEKIDKAKKDKEEMLLATLLFTQEVKLETKWGALKQYISFPRQTNFYRDIVWLIHNFLEKKSIERYLPREKFKQSFEVLSAKDAEKVKKTVIEALLSDFDEGCFLSNSNKDSLNLKEQLEDRRKTQEEKWLAVWTYCSNVNNRKEKLYEQALGIFSALLPALKGKAFVKDVAVLDLSKVKGLFKKVYKVNLIQGILSANSIYFYSDYVSKNLIRILANEDIRLDAKWAALEEYMSLPTNKKRELYKEVQKRFNWLTRLKTSRNYRTRFFSDAIFEHDAGLTFFPVTLPLGTIRALTRHPLSQLEYEKVLSQLVRFIKKVDEGTKQDFIAKIASAYQQRKSLFFSSKESGKLLVKLQGAETLQSKCEAIISYMFVRNEAGYYINNGKKMCSIIQEHLKPHLNQIELHPITHFKIDKTCITTSSPI